MQERLGETLWSKQALALRALTKHRKVAIASAHQIGKSFLAARAVCWWIDAHPPGTAFVVTSAPSAKQVAAILWREIGHAHAAGRLAGRLNSTEWKVPQLLPARHGLNSDGSPSLSTREELVAFGRKPDDYQPTAFQGIHSRYTLVVWDEACGIPYTLWEAGDSLIANDDSQALAIGNPDDPASEFAKICSPGSGWHVINISAFDTPNFTKEEVPSSVSVNLIGRRYVEEKRKRWASTWVWSPDQTKVLPPDGEDFERAIRSTNPLWQSKVLGRFPHVASLGGLIPIAWVQAAQRREALVRKHDPSAMGVDVGGGGDSSTIAHRVGPRVRIIFESQNPDTMQTLGEVILRYNDLAPDRVNIDALGLGKGMYDRARELGHDNFYAIDAGGEMLDADHFVNRRSELWWAVREIFERGEIDIDPEDDDLAAELVSIQFLRTSTGKIQIESKRDAKRRGVPSPNRADALMLTYADLVKDKPKGIARPLWGGRRGHGRRR